jgi:hypothetical protein
MFWSKQWNFFSFRDIHIGNHHPPMHTVMVMPAMLPAKLLLFLAVWSSYDEPTSDATQRTQSQLSKRYEVQFHTFT